MEKLYVILEPIISLYKSSTLGRKCHCQSIFDYDIPSDET